MSEKRRLLHCVEAWPGCVSGGYDPRCCRFPKSCSATGYDPDHVTDADLEPPAVVSVPSPEPDERAVTDEQFDAAWEAYMRTPSRNGMATALRDAVAAALAVRDTERDAETERLRALVKRMASAAANYGSRVYMVGYEPDIAQYLTAEEIRTNGERPSENSDRMAYERDGARAELAAVQATLTRVLGIADDIEAEFGVYKIEADMVVHRIRAVVGEPTPPTKKEN